MPPPAEAPSLTLPDQRLPWLAALVALSAVCAVVAPLLTYTLTLAVFGLPHVVQELRWIRHRFAGALGWTLMPLGGLLLVICTARLTALAGWLPYPLLRTIELGCATGLVAVMAPLLWRSRAAVPATLLMVALVAGLVWAPIPTLLVVAVSHNWTPLGLLMDARGDRRWLALAAVALTGLPLLIATGLPWQLLMHLNAHALTADVLTGGTLDAQYAAYLPSSWHGSRWAQHLFSAIALAQCVHYIAVLGVLPATRMHEDPVVPSLRWLGVALLVATAALFGLYAIDFGSARELYGSVSAVHAWLEVPILLLLLGTAHR